MPRLDQKNVGDMIKASEWNQVADFVNLFEMRGMGGVTIRKTANNIWTIAGPTVPTTCQGIITENLFNGYYKAKRLGPAPKAMNTSASFDMPMDGESLESSDTSIVIQHVNECTNSDTAPNTEGNRLHVGTPFIGYLAGVTTDTSPIPVYRVFGDVLPRATGIYQVLMSVDDMTPPTLAFRYVCFHS